MTNISFISGTRADYGKIKPYIDFLTSHTDKKISVFVTGMNMLSKYGSTYKFIKKDLKDICNVVIDKKFKETSTAIEMAHIIQAYDSYLKKEQIDFVFVHGDRPEVLAAASASIFNNIPVCHIEAGDLSGSIDESIRHATSKLSHQFLVADKEAKKLLIQMGENENRIHITGNSSLAFLINPPTKKELSQLNKFKNYAVLIYHPVTTLDENLLKNELETLLEKLKESGKEIVIISPNNDLGSDIILNIYQNYTSYKNFHFVKSFSFNAFNYLLRNADFLIGNSSCGIKEAPFYNTPVIDIGCRQKNRYQHLKLENFYHLDTLDDLNKFIKQIESKPAKRTQPLYRKAFFKNLKTVFTDDFFNVSIQKHFNK